MGDEPTGAEPDPDQASSVGPRPDEHDLPDDDSLLGTPLSSLFGPHALLGVGLLCISLFAMLWPERTDEVLGRLFGATLVVGSLVMGLHVLRDREGARIRRLILPLVALGTGVVFLVDPVWALESVVELVGLFAVVRGVVVVLSMIRRRVATTWEVASSAMWLISGVALMLYGERLLLWGTVLVAGLGGVLAILQVVAVSSYDGPGDTPVSDIVRSYVRRRPDSREDRQVLLEKVFYEGEQSGTRFARFVMLMLFASVISTTGVITDSTAVVIGAMLVAPLMIPLMGTTLSITMGWPNRMRRCAGIAASGAVLAILTGALVSALVPGALNLTTNSQVTSRVSPTSIDLLIAIAAGAAGAYALSRRDVSDSLPGVAVAIALVPPLTVAGLCWQQQDWESGNGALLLFLTNAVAILIAGGATFVVLGVSPIQRVSEGQKRLRTVIASLVSVSAVILLLLTLNGRSLAEADRSRAGVHTVLAEWNAENPEWTVIDERQAGSDTLVVDLAGPGDPPGLDELLDDLRAELSRDIELHVTWVEQQRTVLGGADDG